MNVNIVKHDGKKALAANAVLVRKNSSLSILNLSKDEKDFVTAQLKSDKKFITLNRYKSVVFLIIIDKKEDSFHHGVHYMSGILFSCERGPNYLTPAYPSNEKIRHRNGGLQT